MVSTLMAELPSTLQATEGDRFLAVLVNFRERLRDILRSDEPAAVRSRALVAVWGEYESELTPEWCRQALRAEGAADFLAYGREPEPPSVMDQAPAWIHA